ncbi:MAG: fumarylacetoacetate hydrolase family protein [Acidobacteria bacterium]|nr:fumarylacetoacetate hydrolase family protein [Acidobacteriota bacterium]
MRLFNTARGPIVEADGAFYPAPITDWDALFNHPDLAGTLASTVRQGHRIQDPDPVAHALAPIGRQEVWAAGVTYFRSRSARIEESKSAGGGDFYDRVYQAPRPELFFKATPQRVVGPGGALRIRRDSAWNVPEPELALAVNESGAIIGYSIGNDMSSRDIEGENPLYLPQAKVYAQCCGLGPAIYVASTPLDPTTGIRIVIERDGSTAFEGGCQLSAMKRTADELVEFLYRDNTFPDGCFLLTGTGIVPPDDFTLRAGDTVRITIDRIGTLINTVVQSSSHT